MRKIVAGLAITLDGVVDSPSGNWLLFSDEVAEVIGAGVAGSDAILLGRRTYLDFAELWPKQPAGDPMADFMNNTPKYVLSGSLQPPLAWENSTLLGGNLSEEVAKLKALPGRDIQVPGSPQLVRSLLRAGLLDELDLLLHPIVLGSGTRLFDGLTGPMRLELADSRALSNGVLMLSYRSPNG